MHCLHHHVLLRPPPPPPPPPRRPKTLTLIPLPPPLLRRPRPPPPHSSYPFAADELPAVDPIDDEAFLEAFRPKDKETEDEARRRDWVDRDWAPWEEILTPEADFARKSLNEGEEVALQSPEAIEAFRMLRPSYRRRKMEESGLSEDEYIAKQFEVKGEVPEPLETAWDGPVGVRLMPPRDWPPNGWEVDEEELEFIRGAHRLEAERVDLENGEVRTETEGACVERYEVFLKQYKEWVAANKDRLEEESYKVVMRYVGN